MDHPTLPPAGTGAAAMVFAELAAIHYWPDSSDRNPIAGLIICSAASAGRRVTLNKDSPSKPKWDAHEYFRIREYGRFIAGAHLANDVVYTSYTVYRTASGEYYHVIPSPAPGSEDGSEAPSDEWTEDDTGDVGGLKWLCRNADGSIVPDPEPREQARLMVLLAYLAKRGSYEPSNFRGGAPHPCAQQQFLM